PGLPAIGRFVDAVADRDAVARPAFASADPDVLRIFWIEREGADGLDRLFVEDRLVTRAAILGFPNAAAGRADEDGQLAGRFPRGRDGRDAPAHGRRTDIARAEPGDGGGIKRSLLGGPGRAGDRQKGNERIFQETHNDYLEAVGNLEGASATGTVASALSKTTFCLSVAPLGPASIENGKKTPLIFS